MRIAFVVFATTLLLLLDCIYCKNAGRRNEQPKDSKPSAIEKQSGVAPVESSGGHRDATFDKLKCRYRKSCYDGTEGASEIPVQPTPTEDSKVYVDTAPLPAGKYSEGQLKLLCKYRTSCYEKRGINDTTGKGKKKAASILTSKPSRIVTQAITQKQKRVRTVQEIAEAAIMQLKERDRSAFNQPLPKISHGKQLLLDAKESLKSRNACKYRKSCYKNGQLPDIPSTQLLPSWLKMPNIPWNLHHVTEYARSPQASAKSFEEMEPPEKRVFCKYRKSCYNTGILPDISDETKFRIKDVVKREKVELPLELRCRYRKSCYETGILPPQFSKVKESSMESRIEGERESGNKRPTPLKQKPLPTSIDELRLFCKYRRSCYMSQAQQNKPVEKIELSEASKHQAVNETNSKLVTEDSKHPVAGNPHPKVPVTQRRKEKLDRLAQRPPQRGGKWLGSAVGKGKSKKLGRTVSKATSGVGNQKSKRRVEEKRSEAVEKQVEKPPIKSTRTGVSPKLRKKEEKKEIEETIAIESGEGEAQWAPTEQYISPGAKVKCRYRKSCYASLVVVEETKIKPRVESRRIQSAGAEKASAISHSPQLTSEQKLYCKYRKSCYPEIAQDEEDENPKQDTDAKVTETSKSNRERDLPSTYKRSAEGQYLSSAMKLECKYRHSCYHNIQHHQSQLNHSSSRRKAEVPKTPMLPEVPPAAYCNKYWISCQKEQGMPIKEKAPVGPDGKKLCLRKKPD